MDILESQHRKIITVLVAVILAGGAYWMLKHFHPTLFLGEPDLVVETETVPTPTASPPTPSAPTPKPEIAIHVTGAVRSPGVYYLSTDARVHEAIEKAGGETDRADIHNLNLAAKVRDGEQIYVPEIREVPDVGQAAPVPSAVKDLTSPSSTASPQPSVKRAAPSDGTRININTATSQELQTLRGIGPAMARRIIEYRQTSGRFSTVDDLTNVKGIGEKTIEKLRDSITVY